MIKTRKEMAQYLDDRMNKSYSELLRDQKLEVDTNLVKTYLLEAHLPKTSDHHSLMEFLNSRITRQKFVNVKAGKVLPTEENSLFLLRFIRTATAEEVVLFLDASDPRFWLLHSMDRSLILDEIMQKLVANVPQLDRVWLPIQLLEKITESGSFRGLGLDYDRREVADIDFEREDLPVEFMKMQLWGNNARKVLEILRSEDAFPHSTTLSKVKIKFWTDRGEDEKFTLDDIKFNGKIAARGTSFASHIALTTDLYRKYISEIIKIETQYAIGYEVKEKTYSIKGDPITILFAEPVKNLERFCESIFDCSLPFKLWGLPIKITDGYYRIAAVDLHVGNPLTFEVTSEYMRVYLPTVSCGNTIARLYTNLQHYYDSKTEIKVGDDGPIFKY